MSISTASRLSDTELVAEVKRLAGSERGVTVELIIHLAELETRRLHLSAGFPSLFAYCTGALSLSEDAAFNRIRAARAARRFPCILDMLREGSLNVTTVRLLGPRLTAENHEELLAAAVRKKRPEVEALLAQRFPQPDTPATIRKLPAPRAVVATLPLVTPAASTPIAPTPAGPPSSSPGPTATALPAAPATAPMPARQPLVLKPLAPDRYRVTFTASTETCEMLDRAKGLLRHAVPSGDTAEIVRRALQALLEKLERQKFAATQQPRLGHRAAKAGSRYVPAEVKRAVWIRDGGRCAFVGSTGRRCEERGGLEFHHVHSFARGGPATVENIQLRCRAHNAHEADIEFGARRPGGEWDVSEPPARCGSEVVPGPPG
jgi:5-methylcytosine-specific restriction endonuclease McrA